MNTIPLKDAKLLTTVRNELFTMTNASFDEQQNYDASSVLELTDQLELLRSLVEQAKKVFQCREEHIESMASLLKSEHEAVIMMSKGENAEKYTQISLNNFNESMKILDSDHKLNEM